MKDLTQGNTFKVIFKFAIPLLLAGLLAQSYNLVDLIIAGKVIGSDALSATGCTSTLIQFLSSLFWGFGVAVAAVVGKEFGAKEYKRIILTSKTVLYFVTIVMFVITFVCFFTSMNIMYLFKVDPEIIVEANIYFKVYMIGLFIQSICYIITNILNALGNSKYPLMMTCVSGLGNIVLNLVFVICFRTGIVGLAIATAISNGISLILGLIKMHFTLKELGGNSHFEYSIQDLGYVSKLAIPCILQQCSLYLASIIVQPFINGMGKSVSAGYSIAMNVNLFITAAYHSFSRAIASYISQSKGEKKFQNYKKGIYIGMIQQLIIIIPLMMICFFFSRQIFSIFMKTDDTLCLEYASPFIHLCLPFLIFASLGNLMHSFYKAVESVKTVLVSTIIFTISRISLTYLIPKTDDLFSVYLALSLAWVIESIVLMGIFYSGIWKSKEQKEVEKNHK